MFKFTKTKLLSLAVMVSCSQVDAANWLNLQGMQPEEVAPKGVKVPYRSKTPKVWGFIQANYKKDYTKDVELGGGLKNPFGRLNPDLAGHEGFNIFRARLAARGMADKDNKINYFFMTEFGNNGINNLAGHREVATYFTDASITMKHIPGAKLRMGMFKIPGSEEGLQAVFVSPYIEFTTMSNQQLLERKISVATNASGDTLNGTTDQPIGAYRDNGIQVFDTFDLGNDLELTYAFMLGNGSGISQSSSNENKTKYYYLALEKSFGKGRGYYTESAKVFAWSQDGSRRVYNTTNAALEDYDRKRSGVGATYYKNGLRLETEFTQAKGMIFTGAADSDATAGQETWNFNFEAGSDNKADGYYINAQYEILPKTFEVFARYDELDRMSNSSKDQRIFKTTTLGMSYRFKGPTRLDFNYLMRTLDAPDPANANVTKIMNSMDDRLAIQFTAAF